MSTPTNCWLRRIWNRVAGKKLLLDQTLTRCRKCLAKCSTQALISKWTAASLTVCLRMLIILTSVIRQFRRCIHPPVWPNIMSDATFISDMLFMPDFCTARIDFSGGAAKDICRSIQIKNAPSNQTLLFLCHNYKARVMMHFGGKPLSPIKKRRIFILGATK